MDGGVPQTPVGVDSGGVPPIAVENAVPKPQQLRTILNSRFRLGTHGIEGLNLTQLRRPRAYGSTLQKCVCGRLQVRLNTNTKQNTHEKRVTQTRSSDYITSNAKNRDGLPRHALQMFSGHRMTLLNQIYLYTIPSIIFMDTTLDIHHPLSTRPPPCIKLTKYAQKQPKT